MTLLPHAVLTTVQLVGGLAASAKNALDVAKASSDHELKAAMSELYDSVLDVKGRVLDLDEENRRLKEELAKKDEIIGPVGVNGFFYYKSKPENPLCPKCWQGSKSKNAVFLTEDNAYGTAGYKCIICNYKFDR